MVINIGANRRRIHMLSSYRDLLVWQKAMELVVETYRFSSRFPKEERYGLTSQLRRAGISIPSNIAEGYGRASRKEYLQFLYVGQGSLKEAETQIILAEMLGYVSKDATEPLLGKAALVGKLLGGLIRALQRKTSVP
jgi:four helix bundle protein